MIPQIVKYEINKSTIINYAILYIVLMVLLPKYLNFELDQIAFEKEFVVKPGEMIPASIIRSKSFEPEYTIEIGDSSNCGKYINSSDSIRIFEIQKSDICTLQAGEIYSNGCGYGGYQFRLNYTNSRCNLKTSNINAKLYIESCSKNIINKGAIIHSEAPLTLLKTQDGYFIEWFLFFYQVYFLVIFIYMAYIFANASLNAFGNIWDIYNDMIVSNNPLPPAPRHSETDEVGR